MPITDYELIDVHDFQAKFGMPNSLYPTLLTKRHLEGRLKFLQEEVNELCDAAEVDDLVKMADALIDLVYVAKGTALRMGLAAAWPHMWNRVHRANMAKVICTVPDARGYKGLIKPAGWVAPDHTPTLMHHGWDPARKQAEHERCDDPTMGDH